MTILDPPGHSLVLQSVRQGGTLLSRVIHGYVEYTHAPEHRLGIRVQRAKALRFGQRTRLLQAQALASSSCPSHAILGETKFRPKGKPRYSTENTTGSYQRHRSAYPRHLHSLAYAGSHSALEADLEPEMSSAIRKMVATRDNL